MVESKDSKIWLRFVFELVIWLNQVTFISWTQPSGRFALGNVFYTWKNCTKAMFQNLCQQSMNHQYKMCYVTPKAHTITHQICQLTKFTKCKKAGFCIHGQKINTASPKNSIDGVWALFQHCDWQWYLDINKNDLKQDKISNANSVIIFLINLLMVRVIAHLVR